MGRSSTFIFFHFRFLEVGWQCGRVCGMASGIFFNVDDVTHELELSLFDGASVWRAIVDGWDVFFFECGLDADIVEAVSMASLVYRTGLGGWR